jgi:uncharacterized protein (TIGR04141 family)
MAKHKLAKFNIHRVSGDLESLLEKFQIVGLKKVADKEVDGCRLQFYFSEEPEFVEIWWAELYSEYLSSMGKLLRNTNYYGALIISCDSSHFVVSLGKTHFYLRNFCDPDFGLDLAQRIADERNLRIKNSKFFQSTRSKIITTYMNGVPWEYDSGESMHYLKAKTIDEHVWGKVASFGTSVQLVLPFMPEDLPDLIRKMLRKLDEEPRFEIPRADLIKDDVQKASLDRKLARAIMGKGGRSPLAVGEFSVSGIEFVFSDADSYLIYMPYHKDDGMLVNDLTIEALRDFVHGNSIDLETALNDIRVVVSRRGNSYTEHLKHYLEFVDDDKALCHLDGNWYRFNQSYVRYLAGQVDSLVLDHDPAFDTSDDAMTEDHFVQSRAKQNGFTATHRVATQVDNKFSIEEMDLYKDHIAYFVKVGQPPDMCYLIDQSLNMVQLMRSGTLEPRVNGVPARVGSVCLWMVLERETKLNKLSDIRSIILQMKLVEWKRAVANAGYEPKVCVNYKYRGARLQASL